MSTRSCWRRVRSRRCPKGETPQLPRAFARIKKLGMVREPATFISCIADNRGEELEYNGVTTSQVLDEDMGFSDVLAFLWFRRQLPKACTQFVEMSLLVTTDHGSAVFPHCPALAVGIVLTGVANC